MSRSASDKCSRNVIVSVFSRLLKLGTRNKAKRKRVATAIATLPQPVVETSERHISPMVRVTMSPPRNSNLPEGGAQQQPQEVPQPQQPQQALNGTPPSTGNRPHTRSSRDYIFGKMVGEGSFSTVYLCKDIHCGKEFAIKVCDKRHIIRELKTANVKRERDILNTVSSNIRANSPFFVKLYCTFQDSDRLYYVLSYAKNGELLPYINKVGSFDFKCTQFYAAEIVHALEFLHSLDIIHRDLKPENILLDENMHILITDFGSAKSLNTVENKDEESKNSAPSSTSSPPSTPPKTPPSSPSPPSNTSPQGRLRRRRNSFVGTAQYVSPELLVDKAAGKSSDLWALGCITYQMVSGLPPFRSRSEYLIFQSILKLDYEFPDGFYPLAKKFVLDLLVIKPEKRLGFFDTDGYPSVKAHPFFEGIDFDTLYLQTPPPIYPYLPGTSEHEELRSHYRVPDHLEPGLDDKQLTRLLGLDLQDSSSQSSSNNQVNGEVRIDRETKEKERKSSRKKTGIMDLTVPEIQERLIDQELNNSAWHSLVQGNLILKQGLIDKRKGLFSRRRMLLLTLGPHLYYVDPVNMVLKGEIPWSPQLRVEPKNFKIFFVHTPNRTYYLEDSEGYALEWCRVIEEVRIHYHGLQ